MQSEPIFEEKNGSAKTFDYGYPYCWAEQFFTSCQ